VAPVASEPTWHQQNEALAASVAPAPYDETGGAGVPMIDVFTAAGTFTDMHALACTLAQELLDVYGLKDNAWLRQNTAAYIHEWPTSAFANANGDSDYIRVRVLTAAGALSREQKIETVERLTAAIAQAPGNPPPPERIWVILTEAADTGWGLAGHAHTTDDLYQKCAEPASPNAQ
jgi:phenylpyruvate tautomerase PptA (4-oxalocrotonate tautomerase family)